MVFRRKKTGTINPEALAGMRGRGKPDAGFSSSAAASQNPLARRIQADDEPETIDLTEPGRFPPPEEADEDITRVLVTSPADEEVPELNDPVAGFLVVIEGPGRGRVFTVGYGLNSVGRDPAQRIALDFGDQQITRVTHCLLTFDPATGKFYVQAGEGRSLCYLDSEPVLIPTELKSGNHLRLGNTMLRFVALCGDGFSWGGV